MDLRCGPARRKFARHADAGPLPIEVDPATPITGRSLDDDEDASQHRRITADLRGRIACGAFQPGDLLPALADSPALRRSDQHGSSLLRHPERRWPDRSHAWKRAVVSPGVD